MTLVGWCPGARPVADMLKLYPEPGAVRLFYGFRDPVPTTWGGPDLDPLGPGVLPVLSFKVWNLPAMLALADAIPPGVVVGLSYHHEDEQQDGGDIPPELFVAQWVELARAFVGHPKRGQVILAPIFTRYWWEKHPGDLRYWPGEVAHLLDAVGWDVYNNGLSYRTPDDLLRIPREMAAATGLPYFVGELGAVRLAGDDGGAGRSAWMRAMVDAARRDGALAVCWFHKDEWDLTGPASAGEQQTWRELIEQEASMTWIQGQPWRVVRSLDRLNEQIRAAYPRAVPPATPAASWGSIADSAHNSTSDHYPHYYSALGKTAVVCARDFPHAPTLGLDAHALADRLRASRDPRISYVISNGRITGPSHNWQWDNYGGSDPHDTHIHVSTVHTAAADDPRDWQIANGEDPDDMDQATFDKLLKGALTGSSTDAKAVQANIRALPWAYPVRPDASALNVLFGQSLPQLAAAVKGLGEAVARESSNPDEVRALLAELPQPAPVDVDGLAAALAERVKASLPEGASISDEQLKRVLRDLLGSLNDAPQAG